MKHYILVYKYPDNFEQHLNLQLKERNSFNNSIQNVIFIKNIYNHEAKIYKEKRKQYMLINCLKQSLDGVFVLAVSANCITVSVTGVNVLVAIGIGPGFMYIQ